MGEAWKRMDDCTTPAEIADKLREVWPMIEAGPMTMARRRLIHRAADLLEQMVEKEATDG